MTLPFPVSHQVFRYRNPYNACNGACGVSIFMTAPDMAVVVLTELPDNPGMSITNSFEHVAASVKDILLPGIGASEIIWVERYPAASQDIEAHIAGCYGETFDLVRLKFGPNGYSDPVWSPIGRNRSQAEFWRVLFMSEWPLVEFPDLSASEIAPG